MPRGIRADLSLADLQRMVERRQSDLKSLSRERDQLLKELAKVDDKIHATTGGKSAIGRPAGTGTRPRNEQNLVEAVETVLSKSKGPMSVGDIMDGVLSTGYRSSSPQFRGIINQTLIKERKKFANTARGMYEIKK